MTAESTFVVKWMTVNDETETKRFNSTSYPRIECHMDSSHMGSEIYDIYSDSERELSVYATRFIHIRRE